jgi:hypothetical protein
MNNGKGMGRKVRRRAKEGDWSAGFSYIWNVFRDNFILTAESINELAFVTKGINDGR